jgi:hypothetical protein
MKIDYEKLVVLSHWNVETLVIALSENFLGTNATGAVGIKKEFKPTHDGVMDIIRDYIREYTGITIKDPRKLDKQQIEKIKFIKLLEDRISPYIEANGFKIPTKLKDLVRKSKHQLDGTLNIKTNDKTNKNIFPPPDGTKWQDVSIGFNNNVQITIAISKAKSIFTVEEWSKVMPSKKSSDFLSIIINKSGVFNRESFKEEIQKTYYNQYLSNLRKDLKSLFNISEDPFKANETDGGHQTLFSCHCEIMLPTESSDLSPEDNTPKGIKKQTDAYQ